MLLLITVAGAAQRSRVVQAEEILKKIELGPAGAVRQCHHRGRPEHQQAGASKEAFFDDARINGTLFLYRTKYDKLNIRWSSIHDLAYDDTAYYLLTTATAFVL